MDLEVKGDNILKSADIMQRCLLIYNFMKPAPEVEIEKIDREASVGDGDAA